MIVGKAALETKFKIQGLEVSSRILKNLQEVGRRAVSEPVGGVREFITELKQDSKEDAATLRAKVERLQKQLESRAKFRDNLTN